MWILRLVRNFALLAVLALASHAAAGADRHGNPRCGGSCNFGLSCPKQCVCVDIGSQGGSSICMPKHL
jgi:hypothetical protein